MKTKLKYASLLTLLLGINLFAQTFSVDSKDGRNQASFISDAPLEKTVGLSAGLDAAVMLNVNDITVKPMGKVKVAVNNIKTGIDLRDEHLRSEMWLNSSKYPSIEFQLTGIKNASSKKLNDGQKVNATLVGKFSAHGVTKDIEVPATLTYLKESERTKSRTPGNLLVVNTEFSIKLSDYGIMIPPMVAGKLGEEVKITTNFVASDANSGGTNPCGTCSPKKADAGKCNPCAVKKADAKSNPCNPCAPKKK
ncbi:MAG: YceI family protein [Ignavibacteriales bacterium]|nr:YceI family protein [Ignavibacteriales bacterium]